MQGCVARVHSVFPLAAPHASQKRNSRVTSCRVHAMLDGTTHVSRDWMALSEGPKRLFLVKEGFAASQSSF